MIRLVLADDQALIRAGLRMILDAEADFEIVSEANDGDNEIAEQLFVSERTVKSHVGSIFIKLAARDRAAAIIAAFRAGLVS